MRVHSILTAVLLIGSVCLLSGHEVVINNSRLTCKGYTLIIADDEHSSLIDMEGTVVRTWPVTGSPVKMLPDGSVIGTRGISTEYTTTWLELVQLDWQGRETWRIEDTVHHDFHRAGSPVGYYAPGSEPAISGPTLILAKRGMLNKSISRREIEDEYIYEVDAKGRPTGWEWIASEHFSEWGFGPKARRRIKQKGGDYLHINTVNRVGPNPWYESGDQRFHPDNIIISSREANVVAILHRETGAFVWRLGPIYNEVPFGQVIGQHHAHIIPQGLPGAGNMLLIDNGGVAGYPSVRRDYSRVLEFNPTTLELVWMWEPDGELFTPLCGSVQRLPNGNTLVDQAVGSMAFEVTRDGTVVWQCSSGVPLDYRVYRVAPEWVPGNPAGYPLWGLSAGG